MKHWIILLMTFSFSTTLWAAKVEKNHCAAAAVKEARKKFKNLFDQKDYGKARAVYDELKCLTVDADPEAYYWAQSDKALSYSKEGNYLECLKVLAPTTDPFQGYVGNGIDESSAVAKAIDHNMDTCEKQQATEFATYGHKSCTLKGLPESETTVQVSDSTCLILQNAKSEMEPGADEPKDFKEVCPLVVLAEKTAGSPKLTTLLPSQGPLADVDSCCALESLGYKEEKGVKKIEVSGSSPVHGCYTQGTARWKSQAIYEIKDSSLELEKDLTIGYH